MKTFKNDEEYFNDNTHISNSQLKDFDHCEYLYEGKHITKIFKDEEEHDYFTYGNAVDCLLTEPEGTFDQRFFPIDRRIDVSELDQLIETKKIIKMEIDEKVKFNKPVKMLSDKLEKINEKIKTIQELEGKTQMTISMFDNVNKSAQELLRQPLYKLFGVKEQGGAQEIITGNINGLDCKGKLDYINVTKKVIADVKTVSTMERFDPKFYARQLAFYRLLAAGKHKTKPEDWDCYLLVVDKGTNVKRSEIFHLSKRIIDVAEEELLASLEKFKLVKDSGFYTPITEKPDTQNARKEKCFGCPFYNQCQFSIQKDITLID